MFTGTALEDPDPMGGVDPDTNQVLRDAMTAVDGRHYRPDHARMSNQELAAARAAARTNLAQARHLLFVAENNLADLRSRRAPDPDEIAREIVSVEYTRGIVARDRADLAAIDAEQRLRTIPGYAPPARKAKPARPAQAATASNFSYDMGFDQPRDTGYGL